MTASRSVRALAGVALSALALAALPANAQTTAPAAPRPSPSASAVPGAVRSPIPAASGAPANGASGGPAALDATRLPTLAPADQTPPLPYPAFGTPSPVTEGAVPPSGIPQIVTLQQAILIAYARSPQLASARAAVEAAAAPVISARAGELPTVTGTASTSRAHRQPGSTTSGGTGGTGGTGAAFSADVTTNSLNASVRQLIFDGGRVAALVRQAQANENAQVATYQRSLQTVAFNVATAYYTTLSAERQTQVALATVRLAQVQENLVSAQIRAGTTARADLATAQLSTAQARVAVIRSQANELNQLATLANTLGVDANTRIQPKDDVPALSVTSGTLNVTPAFPTPTYQQALARAYALRPDLAATHQQIASAQQALRAARLGYFPTLSGTGSYGTTSTTPNGGDFRNASSIGVSLSIPIFDAGLTRAQIVQAQAQLDQANAQLAISQNTVQLNVRQALVNLVSAYAALAQANQELSTAQTVLRSTQAQYAAGVTTLPLLLNAQNGIATALTDETTSVYNVRQAEQALLFAEGANAAG